jgi:hypothetical protein
MKNNFQKANEGSREFYSLTGIVPDIVEKDWYKFGRLRKDKSQP